jgi:hypothetical protein
MKKDRSKFIRNLIAGGIVLIASQVYAGDVAVSLRRTGSTTSGCYSVVVQNFTSEERDIYVNFSWRDKVSGHYGTTGYLGSTAIPDPNYAFAASAIHSTVGANSSREISIDNFFQMMGSIEPHILFFAGDCNKLEATIIGLPRNNKSTWQIFTENQQRERADMATRAQEAAARAQALQEERRQRETERRNQITNTRQEEQRHTENRESQFRLTQQEQLCKEAAVRAGQQTELPNPEHTYFTPIPWGSAFTVPACQNLSNLQFAYDAYERTYWGHLETIGWCKDETKIFRAQPNSGCRALVIDSQNNTEASIPSPQRDFAKEDAEQQRQQQELAKRQRAQEEARRRQIEEQRRQAEIRRQQEIEHQRQQDALLATQIRLNTISFDKAVKTVEQETQKSNSQHTTDNAALLELLNSLKK